MSDLIQASLAEIRARLAGGDVSAEAVAKACLDRIAETEPSIHALITVREQALEEARALDAQGPDASKPLWGVPRHGQGRHRHQGHAHHSRFQNPRRLQSVL